MTTKAKTTTMDDISIIHHGHNVRAYRKMRKISQAELGKVLGEGWDQKKISQLESQEEVEDAILEKVANALKVSVDEIKSYTPEQVTYNIQHNHEGSNANASHIFSHNYQCTFNPIDKIVELYERLLAAEKEKKS